MSRLYTSPRPSTGAGFRIGVFDTSVLATDVTAAVFRGRPSSIVDGMRYGTLRGFIPHYVWAEVPRVLADLKHEGGAFDLAAAERLWWQQYVPLLHVVCADGLPITATADKFVREDLSDVGILQLAGVLAPVVLFAEDPDLIRHGIAVPKWRNVRAAMGKIDDAEAGMQFPGAAVVGSGPSLYGAARLARTYPVVTGIAAAAVGMCAYVNRDGSTPETRAKLKRIGTRAPAGPGRAVRSGRAAQAQLDAGRTRLRGRRPAPTGRPAARPRTGADDPHRDPRRPARAGADTAPPPDGRTGTPPAPLPRLLPNRTRQMAVGPVRRPDHGTALGIAAVPSRDTVPGRGSFCLSVLLDRQNEGKKREVDFSFEIVVGSNHEVVAPL
jgi:hypothetical protein